MSCSGLCWAASARDGVDGDDRVNRMDGVDRVDGDDGDDRGDRVHRVTGVTGVIVLTGVTRTSKGGEEEGGDVTMARKTNKQGKIGPLSQCELEG